MKDPSEWLVLDKILQRYAGYTARSWAEEDEETKMMLRAVMQAETEVHKAHNPNPNG